MTGRVHEFLLVLAMQRKCTDQLEVTFGAPRVGTPNGMPEPCLNSDVAVPQKLYGMYLTR